MSVFDVDFLSLIWVNIATRFRQVVNYAWLKCLCTPVIWLQGLFNTNRANNLYYLGHDSQVAHIQGVLNDVFDAVSRRLYIGDPRYDNPVTVYLVSETAPGGVQPLLPLYRVADEPGKAPLWLFLNSEIGIDDNCFIVNVPAVLGLTANQVNELIGLVNRYRLPSRNGWSIAYF